MEFVIIIVVAIALAWAVSAVVARRKPAESGGAPGEVVGEHPLSAPTGASVDEVDHAGPAEDRPGDPAQEAMDPDALSSPEEGSGNRR